MSSGTDAGGVTLVTAPRDRYVWGFWPFMGWLSSGTGIFAALFATSEGYWLTGVVTLVVALLVSTWCFRKPD